MSGLLQRLTGQAMNAQTGMPGASRIRPSSAVDARPAQRDALPVVDVPSSLPAMREATAGFEMVRSPPAPRAKPTGLELVTRRRPESMLPDAPLDRVSPVASLDGANPGVPPQPMAGQQEMHGQEAATRVPKPLLPATAVMYPPATAMHSKGAEATGDGDTARAAATPTEVHVHIGRIDVIAAAEPPAPKRTRENTVRKTQSLSEYLARGRNP